jgi:hypothetical protein
MLWVAIYFCFPWSYLTISLNGYSFLVSYVPGDTLLTSPSQQYVEALGDGRGFTSGYIGFTTGTNDALAVINQYTQRKPKNALTKYVPELTRLSKLKFCDKQRNDTNKLTNYPKDWTHTACTDPTFVQTQLDVGHAMYLKPALKYAASVGVQSNLGKAIFYGTVDLMHCLQHTGHAH